MTPFDEEENHTETDTDSNGGGLTNFSVKVNVDRDGFFRRTCPACGRDFKTAINESDLASVLTPEIERTGRELGITSGENNEDRETKLTCPYCATQANTSKMLPEEVVNYITRLVKREIVLPMIQNIFGGLADDSQGNALITLQFSRSILPPRPTHGPEPADMKIVNLLCCGERVKISETWNAMDICPYCGDAVAII